MKSAEPVLIGTDKQIINLRIVPHRLKGLGVNPTHPQRGPAGGGWTSATCRQCLLKFSPTAVA